MTHAPSCRDMHPLLPRSSPSARSLQKICFTVLAASDSTGHECADLAGIRMACCIHRVSPTCKSIVQVVVGESVSAEVQQERVRSAVQRANTAEYCPKDDIVAVKVQYPDAIGIFMQDLGNLRKLATFLSGTEIAFDLVSAVDELSSQVKLEFDFRR
jgi:hypothetical protein